MHSIYKAWVSKELQQQWSQQLENYLLAKKPNNHGELIQAIEEFQKKNG